MTPAQLVTTRETSEKLKAAGWEQGKSLYYWYSMKPALPAHKG